MTTQPRDEDIELLSAYLDGEIDADARAALERRLVQEPPLRAALEELRATVAMLRDLPAVTPPRSFTLDPALARRAPAWGALVGWMRLGSALAAVLLAFSLSCEFMGRQGAAPAAAPLESFAMATAPASVPEADMQMQAEETAPAEAGGGITRQGGDGALESEDTGTSAPNPMMAAEPTPAIEPIAPSTGQVADSAGQPEAAAPPALPQDHAGPAADDALGIPKSTSPDTRSLPVAPARPQDSAPQPIAPIRLVQAALAALVLLLALGSVWLARRQRDQV